jgi:hypothetical protein
VAYVEHPSELVNWRIGLKMAFKVDIIPFLDPIFEKS